MPKLVEVVERALKSAEIEVEAVLDEAWQELKPAAVALGHTVLSQAEAAAEAYVAGLLGGQPLAFADALASVVVQLPADARAVEAAIAGALSAHIAKKMAAAPAG